MKIQLTQVFIIQTIGSSSLAELRGLTCTPPLPLISSTKWFATSIEHQRKKRERGIFSVYEVTDGWASGKPPEKDAQPQEKEVPPLPVALWGPHGAWTQSWTGLVGLAEGLGKELATWHQVCGLTGQHCHWHMLLRTQRKALHLRDLHAAQLHFTAQGAGLEDIAKGGRTSNRCSSSLQHSVPICTFLTYFPTLKCNSREFLMTLVKAQEFTVESSNHL